MAFHRLAPIVYRRTKGKGNVRSYEKIFAVFAKDSKFGHFFWDRRNAEGARRYGTGQSAYATLASDLKKKLGL